MCFSCLQRPHATNSWLQEFSVLLGFRGLFKLTLYLCLRPWAFKLYKKMSFKNRVARGSNTAMVKKKLKANGKYSV